MSETPAVSDLYRTNLLTLLDETFEHVHGYYLDRGTSLFETLAGIDAPTASVRYSPYCSNLAAQVNHTRFYLDVLIEGFRGGAESRADWDGSWQIGEVTGDEWTALVARLRASYLALRAEIEEVEMWDDNTIADGLAIVAHSAYHLGEIRQALAVIPLLVTR